MELILSICLVASPGTCREEALSVSLEQRPAPMQCMMTAMPTIAEWVNTHPKWKVLKWRCSAAGAPGRDI